MSEHEHLHLFGDGLRAMAHAHPHPLGDWPKDRDPLATRAHRHVNGRHSHPHGHAGYEPLAEDRRAIVPVELANG